MAAVVPRMLKAADRPQPGPAARLVSAASEHGLRYAYHLLREGLAARKMRRADMRPHLAARLNLAGAQPGTGVNALLAGLGRRDIAALDYALLEQQGGRAAELFARVSLAEVTDLYTYFRYFGDFRSASWFRVRLLEAHLREQERTPHVMPSALASALELAMPDRILELVGAKPTLEQDRAVVDELTAMAHTLRGDFDRAEPLWSQGFSAADRMFGRAVRGRTLAVVGPAPAVEDLAREIDSFDLVVRTNYLRVPDPKYGTRTDISYYNGGKPRTHHKEIAEVAPSLSWLVSVRADDTQLRAVVPEHPGVRGGHKSARLFLSANPLAFPSILIDLMRFRPGRIKLFGADFFTSLSPYGEGYHSRTVGSDGISHSIRIHDSFSSFELVRQLRRAGLCEGDARVEQVLDMSLQQYAARLQEAHGHCTVANESPAHLNTPNSNSRSKQEAP